MADDKGIALARRSSSAPKAIRISPRNKVNVALPLSMIRADEPVKMRMGDWISAAGLVVTVIGFGVAIRQLSRIADALEADQASHRASREERESRLLAGLLRLTSGLAENIPAGPTGGRSPARITARITSRSGICPRMVGARFVSVDSGLFVPNPSTDVGCQGGGMSDRRSTVRRCPLASTAAGGDC